MGDSGAAARVSPRLPPVAPAGRQAPLEAVLPSFTGKQLQRRQLGIHRNVMGAELEPAAGVDQRPGEGWENGHIVARFARLNSSDYERLSSSGMPTLFFYLARYL